MLKTTAAPLSATSSLRPETAGKQIGSLQNLPGTWSSVDFRTRLAAGVMVLLLLVLYHRVALKLVKDWLNLPDYSHGVLIPFFVLFLIWDKRAIFESTPVQPSWKGIWLVMVGPCSC